MRGRERHTRDGAKPRETAKTAEEAEPRETAKTAEEQNLGDG